MDALDIAIKHFEERYRSYSYIMKVNHDDEPDIDMILRYYFKAPGFVRMEMITPFKGAVLTYDPHRDRAYVRPFAGVKSFVLELDPSSRLIRGPGDHRIDESDILTLLRTAKDLARKGEVDERETEGVVEVRVRGRTMVRGNIAEFLLRFERDTFYPVYASSYNKEGDRIEEVYFEEFKVFEDLEDSLFRLKGK